MVDRTLVPYAAATTSLVHHRVASLASITSLHDHNNHHLHQRTLLSSPGSPPPSSSSSDSAALPIGNWWRDTEWAPGILNNIDVDLASQLSDITSSDSGSGSDIDLSSDYIIPWYDHPPTLAMSHAASVGNIVCYSFFFSSSCNCDIGG